MKKHGYLLIGLAGLLLTGCSFSTKTKQPLFSIKDFESITLSDSSVEYDGKSHKLEVAGNLPDGAIVTYGKNGNQFKNVGTYTVTATVKCDGYRPLYLSGNLSITNKQFEGITFEGATVKYDGLPHTLSIGTLPTKYAGATVTYPSGNTFCNPGEYNVIANISQEGYDTLTKTAKLVIGDKKVFSGLRFADKTVAFNTQPQKLEVTGSLPTGANVSYPNGNTFVMPGRYPVSAKVTAEGYYDLELSATLTITGGDVAASDLVIDDFEGIGDSDLASDWKLERYNNGWESVSAASIKVAKNQVFNGGNSTMRMNIFNHGMDWKATKSISETPKKYKAFMIDTMAVNNAANSTTKVAVQFWFKNLPVPQAYSGYANTYATYTLSNDIPTNWTHWVIPFDDDSLKIAGDDNVTAAFKQLMSMEEMSLFIDKVAILAKPSAVDGGPNAYVYFDNLKLVTGDAYNRISNQEVDMKNRKYTVSSNDDTTFKLTTDGSLNAKLETLNLATNVQLNGKVESIGKSVKVVCPLSATQKVTFRFEATKNASRLELKGIDGDREALVSLSDHLDFSGKLFSEVYVIDDFESYTETGVGYDKNHTAKEAKGLRAAYHSDYYAGSGAKVSLIGDQNWGLMGSTDYLNLKTSGGHNNSKCGDFKANTNQMRYITYGLAAGTAQPIGRGEYLSFWAKADTNLTVAVRPFYVSKESATNQTYTSGDCGYMNAVVTTEWTQIVMPLESSREVYGLDIRPSKPSTAKRMLIDDISIDTAANPFDSYVAPVTIPDYTFGAKIGNNFYGLKLDLAQSKAYFGKLDSMTEMNVHQTKDLLIISNKNNRTTFNVHFKYAGGVLTVLSVDGSKASDYSAALGAKFAKVSTLNYNLTGKSAGGKLVDSAWSSKRYESTGWKNLTDQMNVRSAGSNIFGNMTVSDKMDYVYIYQPTEKLGLSNHFSVDLTNDFGGCADIKLKVKLILNDNSEKTIIGESDYVVIPKNTGDRNNNNWKHLFVNYDPVDVKGIKFVVKSTKSGVDYLYFDNLKVDFLATPEKEAEVALTDGSFVLWNGSSDAYTLKLSDSLTKASLQKIGDQTVYSGTATNSASGLKVEIPNVLTINCEKVDANQLKVSSLSGNYASTFSASFTGKTLKRYASANLDFSDGTKDAFYTSAGWSEKVYKSTGWTNVSPIANIRSKVDKDSNKIINFACDTSARQFNYVPGTEIGPVNSLSIDLGNYFGSTSGAIKFKIILLDKDGNAAKYVAGTSSEWATIAKNTADGNKLNTFNYTFDLTYAYGIRVVTQMASGSGYLYVDNIIAGIK